MSEALIRSLTVHSDHRGSVRETFRASDFPEVPPVVQLVHSRSEAGVMRAMHAHKLQWDLWHFVDGKALVQVYDMATGQDGLVWGHAGLTIAIPPGVAHGFWTPTGCTLIYGLTREYDGTDEYEFDAYDPAFPGRAIWPSRPDAVRSERDINAQSLAAARESFR